MLNSIWLLFSVATVIKILLIPSYHSTDFEVHRNWLAITNSLPLERWYYDKTSQWTLDYPPFFAYFEWCLSKLGEYVDPQMLDIHNLNYVSEKTKLFQRLSVIVGDVVYLLGVTKCLRVVKLQSDSQGLIAAEAFLLFNVGLFFVDHIHFQYNGLLFGILLYSIGLILEERYLSGSLVFSILLNFKHIFLYIAPAYGIFLLRFYILDQKKYIFANMLKLLSVGLTPFIFAFAPFRNHLPQVFSQLFPFKRGLTHAYWAPNFWALYNGADKVLTKFFKVNSSNISTTSGLVQDFDHEILPIVRPIHTFILTLIFMLPILFRVLCYTNRVERKLVFLRSIVLCGGTSFIFGWHVHEKAILLCLIPLSLTSLITKTDARYYLFLGSVGYFSLFPLLFSTDLIIMRYTLYLSYMCLILTQLCRIYNEYPILKTFELFYIVGLLGIPLYEHVLSPLLGLNVKLPFLTLLVTSVYCGFGITYFFVKYYIVYLRITASQQ